MKNKIEKKVMSDFIIFFKKFRKTSKILHFLFSHFKSNRIKINTAATQKILKYFL